MGGVKKFYGGGKKILPGQKILLGTNLDFKGSKSLLTWKPYVICYLCYYNIIYI